MVNLWAISGRGNFHLRLPWDRRGPEACVPRRGAQGLGEAKILGLAGGEFLKSGPEGVPHAMSVRPGGWVSSVE